MGLDLEADTALEVEIVKHFPKEPIAIEKARKRRIEYGRLLIKTRLEKENLLHKCCAHKDLWIAAVSISPQLSNPREK